MRYFILDTETIGLKVPEQGSGVVELCAFEVDSEFNLLNKYHSLIDPENPIAAAATATHGIRASDVEDSPTLAEYLHEVLPVNPWGQGQEPFYFIAHNAPFDNRWLRDFIDCEYTLVDSLKLARKFYPDAESHKLQVLRVELDLPFEFGDAHSADGDVQVLVHFMQRMVKDTGKTLEELCVIAQEKAPLPTKIGFGMYRDKTIAEVVAKDRQYILWCLSNMERLSGEYRDAFNQALTSTSA